MIIDDPVAGTPLVVPLGRRHLQLPRFKLSALPSRHPVFGCHRIAQQHATTSHHPADHRERITIIALPGPSFFTGNDGLTDI